MGNSGSSETRRRYAYPGELAPSDLETKPAVPEPVPPATESKPPVPAPKPATLAPRPAVLGPAPPVVEPKPPVLAPRPASPAQRPAVLAPTPPAVEPKPPVLAPRPTILAPRPAVLAPRPATFGSAPREVRLGVGLDPNRRRANSPAWKDTTAPKKVAARFELLPDPEPRWDRISLSAGGQLAFLAFLLLIPQVFPEEMKTALKFNVVEVMQPVTEFPVAPPPPPPRPPKIRAKVKPPEPKPVELEPKPVVPEPMPVKLNPKQPHVFLVLKPEARNARTVEAKPVELNPVLELVKIEMPTSQPKRPKEDVNVGTLASGSAAQPTLVAPANKVQTGGFGDPNGIAGRGNPNRGANINQAGSPNLPGGPGYGNGTGGANGARGTVAGASKKPASAGGGGNSPVSILDRPNPVYSAEGRTLRIEGDVVLEVVFLASGQVKVNAVVSGLGHGLDEAAIQAAKQIRFKPAIKDGQPVDFPARVRIIFRVAS